jgi:single-strand DNA-binding protein
MSIYATCHGYLGRDAASRSVGQHTVIEFTVACTHGYGDKAVTTWIRVQGWGQYWTSLSERLKKGQEVVIQGEVFEREYQAKDGLKKSIECKASACRLVGGRKESTSSTDSDEVPF